MEIGIWDRYVAASERSLVKEKDTFLSLIKFQYRIARRLYDLLSVEPRPIQDSTLGAAASFASTYIKELSTLKLPEKLLAEAGDLAKKPLENRTELILSFTLRREPFITPIHRFIARLVCVPLASVCYSIDRPDVELRGPSGCGFTKQRKGGTASGESKSAASGCPACGHPPLYMTGAAPAAQTSLLQSENSGVERAGQVNSLTFRCSLCFNAWAFNPPVCVFCGGSDLEVGAAGVVCGSRITGVPSVKEEDFPSALFSIFNPSAYSRPCHTISEEWNRLLRWATAS